MNEFDLLGYELNGIGVIEASAGTGKTFSITKLYLRLLLEQAAEVEQIMVATFTEAAAAELSSRIHDDLSRALELQRGATPDPGGDEILVALMHQAQEMRGDTLDIDRELQLALLSLDRAPIGTIHAFCRRVLAEFAFDAGRPLAVGELGSGEDELRFAFRRIWHQRISADRPAWLRLARDRSATQVLDKLRELLPHARRVAPAIDSAARELEEVRSELAGWRRDQESLGPEAAAVIDAALAGIPDTQGHFARRLKSTGLPASVRRWIVDLDRLARFHFEAYADAFMAVREALEHDLAESRVLTFDGIVEKFAEAVLANPALADAVHNSHPWALVDEFQDTSYDQTEAFLGIWAGRDRGGLIMIGDPKQAIYGFRGGDVYAYLKARKQAQNAATLRHNYRSVPRLLEALNQVFHRDRNPFLIADLDYQPVRSGRPEEMSSQALKVNGQPAKPLTVWFEPEVSRIGDFEAACRAGVVAEIRRLIDLGRAGEGEGAGISPGRCAVLVRSNRQGLAMQQALAAADIPAVCVGDESVFESEEAREILVVLRALAEPGDDRLVRAALCTRLLGYDLEALLAMASDDVVLDRELRRFEAWNLEWRRNGVLASLYPIIAQAGPRTLAQPEGPRRMTNWLHVADLLQQSPANHTGQRALLTWLKARIDNPDGSVEAQKLRLETDDDAVQITTVHRSKGLQYDIVFAPFLWSGKWKTKSISSWGKPGSGPVRYHDRNHDVRFDFGSPSRKSVAVLRFEEELAEDLRLIYVALTRARLKVYASWGNLFRDAWKGGLQWLFCNDPVRNREGKQTTRDGRLLREALAASLGGPAPPTEIAPVPQAEPQRELALARRSRALTAHELGRIAADDWSITSFSRMVSGQPAAPADPLGETGDGPAAESTARAQGDSEVFTDLAGRRFGNFVHGVLEVADFAGLLRGEEDAAIDGQLRRYGFTLPADQREAVGRLFRETVATPLFPGGPRLADVPAEQRVAEMEFHLRLAPTRLDALRRTIADSDWGRETGFRPEDIAHPHSRIHGLMNGFIDLVMTWEDRFFVIDYKSNLLGGGLSEYRPKALARAMIQHRYHLQYLFYTVALHRYLRRVQGVSYDYDRDCAGAFYLFVRGMRGELGAESGIYRRKPEFALIDALDRLLGGVE